mmetsp:Transcript_51546/g.103517  ORF Transcript_51546/g.103517 Transcript_51546/m.103517 type:complete len:208 (-) Transcript_51546:659-1282(-)
MSAMVLGGSPCAFDRFPCHSLRPPQYAQFSLRRCSAWLVVASESTMRPVSKRKMSRSSMRGTPGGSLLRYSNSVVASVAVVVVVVGSSSQNRLSRLLRGTRKSSKVTNALSRPFSAVLEGRLVTVTPALGTGRRPPPTPPPAAPLAAAAPSALAAELEGARWNHPPPASLSCALRSAMSAQNRCGPNDRVVSPSTTKSSARITACSA